MGNKNWKKKWKRKKMKKSSYLKQVSGWGLFLTVNSNTINEEDRLTSPSLLMTSLRGLKVP